MINKAIELGLLTGFRIETSNLMVFHLHYANDTLILTCLFVENLWTINAILRGFGLDFGL